MAPALSIPILRSRALKTWPGAANWAMALLLKLPSKHFMKAIKKGLLKTFSKMGISTLQSYQGAQVFEAIGLNKELVDCILRGHDLSRSKVSVSTSSRPRRNASTNSPSARSPNLKPNSQSAAAITSA